MNTNINPHYWRKFQQAQRNFRIALGFSERDGRWHFTGTRPRKHKLRRERKWGLEMNRLVNKIFYGN